MTHSADCCRMSEDQLTRSRAKVTEFEEQVHGLRAPDRLCKCRVYSTSSAELRSDPNYPRLELGIQERNDAVENLQAQLKVRHSWQENVRFVLIYTNFYRFLLISNNYSLFSTHFY